MNYSPGKRVRSTESVDELTIDDFNQVYFDKRPVMIRQAVQPWPGYKIWSVDYLKQKIGARQVMVDYSKNGLYNDGLKELTSVSGTFEKMVDLFYNINEPDKSYYLAQTSIEESFPELTEDIFIPEWIQPTQDLLLKTNLWMGGKGCDSGLHYDNNQNLFCQVKGKKEVVLFSPEDSE